MLEKNKKNFQQEMFDVDEREQRFLDWLRDNRHIYDEFIKLAFQLVERGHTHYGAQGLVEIIRWHTALKSTDEFKVNNNYAPFMARRAMREYPRLRGFFRTREQH